MEYQLNVSQTIKQTRNKMGKYPSQKNSVAFNMQIAERYRECSKRKCGHNWTLNLFRRPHPRPTSPYKKR